MIVGFEVVACSIKREAGKPISNIPCPQTPEDPNQPEPQEVKKGERGRALRCVVCCFLWLQRSLANMLLRLPMCSAPLGGLMVRAMSSSTARPAARHTHLT